MYVDENAEDFHDFFDEINENQATNPAKADLFHQINPRRHCRLTWGPGCRDHRCSHDCRARWAFKEATILRRHLAAVPPDRHVYFGELVIVGEPSAADHKRFRTKFQKALTALGKDRLGVVKLLATSEVGENLRLHYHYCLVSSFEVKQFTIKTLWAEACGDWRTIVSHSRPRSIDGRAKYMFKDITKHKGKVRLLRKGSPRATWGHLDFYPQGKDAVWETFIEDLKKQVEGQQENGQQQHQLGEPRGEEAGRREPRGREAHTASRPAIKWRPNLERGGESH